MPCTAILASSIRRDGPAGVLSLLVDDDRKRAPRILRKPCRLQRRPPPASPGPALRLEYLPSARPGLRHSLPIDIPWGKAGGRAKEIDAPAAAMVPPHEMAARAWAADAAGAGLRGRDLVRLRDEIWRRLGFEG